MTPNELNALSLPLHSDLFIAEALITHLCHLPGMQTQHLLSHFDLLVCKNVLLLFQSFDMLVRSWEILIATFWKQQTF